MNQVYTLHKLQQYLRVFLSGFVILVFCLAALPATVKATSPPAPNPPQCQSIHLNISLGAGQPANQTVAGTLCKPLWWGNTRHEVDVLMHGSTYNSSYWNFPVGWPQYSYVGQTLLAGRATFAYDAIGAGNSSHPLSTDITASAAAYVSHQVVQWLRTQQRYSTVDLIGHSVGSMIAIDEAGTYHDVNAVVATGLLHNSSPSGSAAIVADRMTANQDSQFSSDNLDSGYITTKAGTRKALFYSSSANPQVIAYDEAHKDVTSGLELGQALGLTTMPASTNISQQVTVPVLEMVGQEDSLFCVGSPISCNAPAQIQANEKTYFLHAPNITTKIIPNTGHDIALHPTNIISFSEINQWIESH